jgi:hypothetical protein
MTVVGDNKLFAMAQRGFRREAVAMFRDVGAQVRGVVLANANPDGTIPQERIARIQTQAGRILERAFVGMDGRSPFGADGVTPLAEYPRILNKWLAFAAGATVMAHHRYLKRTMPDDVFNALARQPARPVPVRQSVPGLPIAERAPVNPDDLTEAQIAALRIFSPNPLAEYDPAHRWVDPNGYRLSDRIWQTEVTMRMKLDMLLADAIRNGMGSMELANLAERFLNPERAKIRTKKPYGQDVSYYAMMLARTEIARAANNASFIAGYLNPYCGGLDVARSPQGDPTCKVCPQHATITIGGGRSRAPYSYDAANIPPYHPNDMCRVQNNVRDDPATVTAQLRGILQRADRGGLDAPMTTPVMPERMLTQMLGDTLYSILVRYFQLPLL